MKNLNRREFIQRTTATGVSLSLPVMASGPLSAATDNVSNKLMATRIIPSSGESLGVIGYGTARAFRQNPVKDKDTPMTLLKMLIEAGGNFIDTDAVIEKNLVVWLNEMGSLDKVFLGNSIGGGSTPGPATPDIERSLAVLGKNTLDLAQVRNAADMDNRWPVMRELKEAGKVRHLGLTIAHHSQYEKLEALMKKYRPDFIQVNYSILEPKTEERILPLASDLGVAVVIMRPFVNGEYFGKVSRHPLPEWVAEFDCKSWSNFSLKYILANPNVTCVLAESSRPKHAQDNLQGGVGRLPDENHLKRMRELMTWI